ncbi:FG-GAP-like repeat-containing protein [Streptomyces sp. 12297]
MSLNRGLLRVADDVSPTSATDRTSLWQIGSDADGALTASAVANGVGTAAPCPVASVSCTPLWGNAASGGDIVHYRGRNAETGKSEDRVRALESKQELRFAPTTGGKLVDASDGLVIFNSGGADPAQYVAEFGRATPLLKRSVRAAAIGSPGSWWGTTSTAGRVERYNAVAKTTTVWETGAPCIPKELQARLTWLYWSCGADGPAGVLSTTTKVSTPAPAGDVLLGDGFTVRHDHGAGTLVLTDAGTGASRNLATAVPGGGMAEDRRVRWTVDEHTNLVAWTDGDEKIHVRSSGITPTPLYWQSGSSRSGFGPLPWDMLLSAPVRSWNLSLTDMAGAPLRRFSGSASPGRIAVTWDMKTSSGRYAPNGPFRWTLSAVPYTAVEPLTVAAHTGSVAGAGAVGHDYDSEGTGDLFALTADHGLEMVAGNPHTGKFDSGSFVGTGWPAGIRPVPIGDMNDDRCNDLLVRFADGELRRYTPACRVAPSPRTASKVIGRGWNQYDILTSPGDVTGDRRSDLIARNAATGDLYLYTRTEEGLFAPRVRVTGSFKGYKRIVGAHDLNGDGHGDLLLQDPANRLWRMKGTGNGGFTPPVKIADNWGAKYRDVIGIGDLTGDARADLLARDTSGRLWRQDGTGEGTFGTRSEIASELQEYVGMY